MTKTELQEKIAALEKEVISIKLTQMCIRDRASRLVKEGAEVHVIMTEHACNFINPITFETLTGNKLSLIHIS